MKINKKLLSSSLAFSLWSAHCYAEQIDFARISNPFLEYSQKSIKDCAVAIREDGSWAVFFSSFYKDRGRVRSHVVGVDSPPTLQSFSSDRFFDDGRADNWKGMASPNISKVDDLWVLTYNSWGDKDGQPNQLFYRTSRNLRTWGPQLPLAKNLTLGQRAIDIAVTQHNGKIYAMWKHGQIPRIARGDKLDGDFEYIGQGLPVFERRNKKTSSRFENYQFFIKDGKMSVLATDMKNDHMPWVFQLSENAAGIENWEFWENGYEISLPKQGFNTRDRANAACLVIDSFNKESYEYLVYAGNREKRRYAKRGHNKLALARTTDLESWEAAKKKNRRNFSR